MRYIILACLFVVLLSGIAFAKPRCNGCGHTIVKFTRPVQLMTINLTANGHSELAAVDVPVFIAGKVLSTGWLYTCRCMSNDGSIYYCEYSALPLFNNSSPSQGLHQVGVCIFRCDPETGEYYFEEETDCLAADCCHDTTDTPLTPAV